MLTLPSSSVADTANNDYIIQHCSQPPAALKTRIMGTTRRPSSVFQNDLKSASAESRVPAICWISERVSVLLPVPDTRSAAVA
jgi:hypothetical protein